MFDELIGDGGLVPTFYEGGRVLPLLFRHFQLYGTLSVI